MLVVFFLIMLTRGTNANALNFLYFDPQMVLRGEVWRIVTYIFVPSTTSVFWLVVGAVFLLLDRLHAGAGVGNGTV